MKCVLPNSQSLDSSKTWRELNHMAYNMINYQQYFEDIPVYKICRKKLDMI